MLHKTSAEQVHELLQEVDEEMYGPVSFEKVLPLPTCAAGVLMCPGANEVRLP